MTYDEIVDRFGGWNVSVPTDTLTGIAAQVVAAKELRKANHTLMQLLNRLDNLGNDGIHTVITHHAAKIRKVERLRRQRMAAKRRATRLRNQARVRQ